MERLLKEKENQIKQIEENNRSEKDSHINQLQKNVENYGRKTVKLFNSKRTVRNLKKIK